MQEGKMFKETRGSLAYSSPAIVMKVPYKGEEEDVWSLGVCLYAMLTGSWSVVVMFAASERGRNGLLMGAGRFPFFDSHSEDITRDKILHEILRFPPEVPPPLKDVIAKMLKRKRKDRITSLDLLQTVQTMVHNPPVNDN
jgi:serine/threonine protein kinase